MHVRYPHSFQIQNLWHKVLILALGRWRKLSSKPAYIHMVCLHTSTYCQAIQKGPVPKFKSNPKRHLSFVGISVYFIKDILISLRPRNPRSRKFPVGLVPGCNERAQASGSPAPRTRSCAPAAARLLGTGLPLAPAAPQRASSSRVSCFWGPDAAASEPDPPRWAAAQGSQSPHGFSSRASHRCCYFPPPSS